MITKELKNDIFSSLLEIVEDSDNHEKICHMFDKMSNPYTAKIKIFIFLLFILIIVIFIISISNLILLCKINNLIYRNSSI